MLQLGDDEPLFISLSIFLFLRVARFLSLSEGGRRSGRGGRGEGQG